MSERESYAVTTAVWLGALVLFGVPTFLFTSSVFAHVVDPVVGRVAGPDPPLALWLLLLIVTFALGLSAALSVTNEVTRIRLHGWEELQRGTFRRRLLRHAVLAIPALAALLFFGATAVEMAIDSFEDHAATSLAVLALLGFGLALILVRSARAFLAGREAGTESGR